MQDLLSKLQDLSAQQTETLKEITIMLKAGTFDVAEQAASSNSFDFLSLFIIFVLACFVGFYVVWSVTPALHSPLMSVTNAISSVIIVGAIIALGAENSGISARIFGFLGVVFASVNIFGGFAVTERMLAMFKKKK